MQLALAAAGSMIGGAMITGTVLGMSGAAIGWMAGSMLGGVLFAPKLPDGPRLNDLSVQNSSYGASIPRVWGAARIAGNVIWSTDLVEHAHEEGGKGGGGSYTTYTYTVSFAVSLCEGPISAVRRIWADGKLIYDISAGTTNQIGFTASSYACYLGTEDQDVDPTIQAHMTSTPAYRGQAYWVFADLELTKYGNRIPNLTFEVVKQAQTFPPYGELAVASPITPTTDGHCRATLDPSTNYLWCYNFTYDPTRIVVYDMVARAVVTTFDAGSAGGDGWWFFNLVYCADEGTMWGYTDEPYTITTLIIDTQTYAVTTQPLPAQPICYNPERRKMVLCSQYALNDTLYEFDIDTHIQTGIMNLGSSYFSSGEYIEKFGYIVITNGARIFVFRASTMDVLLNQATGLSWTYTRYDQTAYDTTRDRILFLSFPSDNYVVLDLASLQLTSGTDAAGKFSRHTSIVYHAYTDKYYVGKDSAFYVFNAETITYESLITDCVQSVSTSYAQPYSLIVSPLDNGHLWCAVNAGAEILHLGVSVDPQMVALSDSVTDLSLACGLTVNDIDVTALTDLMWGFPLARQGSARSALEYLMMAFLFDAVESEGKVKFVKRGAPAALTITADDLAVHEQGQTVPAVLEMSRGDEVELPRNVSIKYINFEADYQTSAQNAIRQSGRALGELTMEMPVVMVDTHAKAVADYALYSAWAARTTAKWATSLKYAKVEPTDVVTVADNLMRVTKRSLQGNILSFEGVMESGITVASAALAGVAPSVAQTIVVYGNTCLLLLDIPMLRDDDDNAGFYLATSGYGEDWPGSVVLKSLDGGASYNQMMTLITPAITGVAAGALGDFDGNVFDEFNTVQVTVFNGELVSLTELAVLNGGNAAVLGNEIIQFKTATLVSDKVYVLSGLLRGRRGSPTRGHVSSERFTMLDAASLRRVPPNAAEIGLERTYMALTVGSTFSSGTPLTFTNTAQGLECLSPVQLGGGRDAAGNLTLTWVRRTRLGGEWRDLVDASLGEDAENYSIDICDDGTYATVVRTLTSVAPTVTYSVVDQTTDFGSAQAMVYAVVYQVSAAMSRGAPLQGVI